MSVKSFITAMFDSDLDFSNVDIDDFIVCVKRLASILCSDSVSGKSRRSGRSRRYNSILAKELGINDKYTLRVSDLYTFSADGVQIDVCIRGSNYYVGVTGDWRPNEKVLTKLLYMDNLNFERHFDFSEVKILGNVKGSFTYYGGSDFPVNDLGFKNILRLWTSVVGAYVSHLSIKLIEET